MIEWPRKRGDTIKKILIILFAFILLACDAEDPAPAFEYLELTEKSITLEIGESHTIAYTVHPEEYTLDALDIVFDPSLLSLEDDSITALAAGETEVHLYYEDTLQDTLLVEVEAPDFAYIELDKTHVELEVGASHTIEYTVHPEEYPLEPLDIEVDAPLLSLEDETLTALEEGETEVHLYYEDTLQDTLLVEVIPLMHTVRFEGADIEKIRLEDGELLPHRKSLPQEEEAREFLGWFYDEDFQEPFDYHDPISEDTTLHAHWLDVHEEYNLENDFAQGPFQPGDDQQYVIIEPDPGNGFHFPYVIYIPSTTHEEENLGYKRYLLFEGYNARPAIEPKDDYDEAARRMGELYGKEIQERLFIPRVVPILPDFGFFDISIYDVEKEELRDMHHSEYPDHTDADSIAVDTFYGYGYYTANLQTYLDTLFPRRFSRQIMGYAEFDFDLYEREDLAAYSDLDEQYLAMIDDALDRLNAAGWNLEEEVFVHGFSASGMFANRFVSIHPERVRAMFAGGFYYPVLPTAELEGHTLNYPLGTADHEELFGEPFDLEAYREVPKLYYIGAQDDRDSLGHEPFYSYHPDQDRIVAEIFGEGMFLDRYEDVTATYFALGGNAYFMKDLYMGHGMRNNHHDIVARFFGIHRNDEGPRFDHSFHEDYIEFHFPSRRRFP